MQKKYANGRTIDNCIQTNGTLLTDEWCRFLQYLPAGLSLAWAYTKSDTIFAPIAIHACINLVAIGGLR